jgi:hypothetical protein
MVTSDGETVTGKRVFAHVLVSARLQQMLWPLYERTRNRKLVRSGAKLLFYQGGKGPGRQTIIGSAEVLDVLDGTRIAEIDPHYSLSAPCETALRLTNLLIFDKPVPLRNLFGEVSFLPIGMKRWGVIVMGGCRRLSRNDFAVVLKAGMTK